MKLYTSPEHIETTPKTPIVFLGGAIDNGAARDWQKEFVHEFKDDNVIFLNPRRKQWDASWEQTIHNPKFKEQVVWELKAQHLADINVYYIPKDSKAPITLLEIGLFSRQYNSKIAICCEPGYWRRGNLEVISEYYSIPLFDEFEQLINWVKQQI